MTAGHNPPWTEDQVARLNEYQQCDWVHEFTCPNRGDDQHEEAFVVFAEGIKKGGALEARRDGFHCSVCGYHQTWAHDFMVLGAPHRPVLP